jgi:hypothetical protein
MSASLDPSNNIAYSSHHNLQTLSGILDNFFKVLATAIIASFHFSCPCVSFTSLKREISMNIKL